MEKVLLNFSLFLIFIYFVRITRHGLHILQLENYYISRYAKWMKRCINKVLNIKTIILLLVPSILILASMANSSLLLPGLIIEILVLMYSIVSFKKQKEKKPFVVTARIKRVYTTYLILFVILVVLANLFNYKIVLPIANIAAILAYFFVYIVTVINKPIEGYIRHGFCKKAKTKLKEIPGLNVIGVTGRYGKTSTKYVVNTILSQK